MSFITDESSIHHSHSFSNRAPVFLAVLRCGWGAEQKDKLSQSAIVSCGKRNGNSTQHCSRESSSTFRPISPYFTPASGWACMHARGCSRTFSLPHSRTHIIHRALNRHSRNPREQTQVDSCRLVRERERERKERGE